MIDWLAPSRTKKVPMIEVTTQTPQIGERIEHHALASSGWPAK